MIRRNLYPDFSLLLPAAEVSCCFDASAATAAAFALLGSHRTEFFLKYGQAGITNYAEGSREREGERRLLGGMDTLYREQKRKRERERVLPQLSMQYQRQRYRVKEGDLEGESRPENQRPS